jgi:ATP-dependent Clp protease ATP-binding subunit ClpA
MLLQIMEEGRLTDNVGRVVDFKNTILIMTTNIGAEEITGRQRLGFAKQDEQSGYEAMKDKLKEVMKNSFRPEFLNRVDDIIVFRPLREEQIERIVDLQLGRLRKLLADRKMTLEVTPAAARALATEGYDPAFGARPLKRAIQRLIQDPLAMQVLEGRFADGDHVVVDAGPDGQLRFERAGAAEPAGARA